MSDTKAPKVANTIDSNATLARAFLMMKQLGVHGLHVQEGSKWIGLILDVDIQPILALYQSGQAPNLAVRPYIRDPLSLILTLKDLVHNPGQPSPEQQRVLELFEQPPIV